MELFCDVVMPIYDVVSSEEITTLLRSSPLWVDLVSLHFELLVCMFMSSRDPFDDGDDDEVISKMR